MILGVFFGGGDKEALGASQTLTLWYGHRVLGLVGRDGGIELVQARGHPLRHVLGPQELGRAVLAVQHPA